MKTNVFKVDWLIPVLGLALVGGGYALTKSYLGLQAEIRAEEQLMVTINRLAEDCRLTQVLLEAQDTGCTVTARSLDELLSANIAAVSSELTSADPQAQAIAEACFKHIARRRSQNSPMAANLPAGRGDLPLAAPRVPEQTLASASPGN
jgi:hypothetical protein